MIDPEKYRVSPDAVAVNVEDEEVLFHGEPLTAGRIAEIVEKVDRSTNLIPGGKSLSGDGKHSPVVRVRLPENVRDALSARAAAQGVSVSKYTRTLIERDLKAS